ncbi:hypothetical protein DVS28_a2255 [Euzebya pacifica]|uniref:Glycosyltransferase n=1 Tax=Euzebya pacifica TaxID=1608957 RepID=A0A346XXJ0_9ACTN|nr:hypothetical protein [Euzebya pacifica]AXV06937.1 hypothetical protein DVS28_a2255 [Euzebya pacifica]
MSVAIWCPGDGLGHLTRAVAASHTLGMAPAGVTLLVDDPSAVDTRLSGVHQLDVARLPLEGVEELWVDALPSGRGELTMAALAGVPTVNHLARRLDWSRYQRLLPADPPRFDRVLVTEPLPDQQRAWLAARSRSVEDVELHDPPAPPPPADIVDLVRGSWLVVHSGPPSEVEELVATARDTARVVRTTARVVVIGSGGLDVLPAWPLLGLAARLFTGGGANTIRQVRLHAPGTPHTAVPFPRRHDDQTARLARLRTAAAAR